MERLVQFLEGFVVMLQRTRIRRWLVWVGVGLGMCGSVVAYQWYTRSLTNSIPPIREWFQNGATRPSLTTQTNAPCPNAPFLLPSSGLIGLLYGDPAAPYHVLRRHSGIDIFGNGTPGTVPIVAAYHGYLTRKADWKSSVIIRHDDPLQVGRTIWTYYTHMADVSGTTSFVHADFPPNTREVFVEQGQLLGYQGEYGGNLRIGLHLHFSIVKSDPQGAYMNETVLANTLDPSPYLGMQLQANRLPSRPINCQNT